jgi:hypothetical protein
MFLLSRFIDNLFDDKTNTGIDIITGIFVEFVDFGGRGEEEGELLLEKPRGELF